MTNKHHKWYYHSPGMSYAGTLEFNTPVTKNDAKEEIRIRWDVKRLPSGTEVWPYTPLPEKKYKSAGERYADMMWM